MYRQVKTEVGRCRPHLRGIKGYPARIHDHNWLAKFHVFLIKTLCILYIYVSIYIYDFYVLIITIISTIIITIIIITIIITIIVTIIIITIIILICVCAVLTPLVLMEAVFLRLFKSPFFVG